MSHTLNVELCIIGDSPGGLRAALIAAAFGLRAAIVRDPATTPAHWATRQSIIASAQRAHAVQHAAQLGIRADDLSIDFEAIKKRALDFEAHLGLRDSNARLRALGLHVVEGAARFTATDRIIVGEQTITARRFILAYPSRPASLPADTYCTDAETSVTALCKRPTLPERMIILGGDAVALEWAQALQRLHVRCTVIAPDHLLPGEDREMVDLIKVQLQREGIALHEHAQLQTITRIDPNHTFRIGFGGDEHQHIVEGDAILNCMITRAAFDDAGLALAGLGSGPAGIRVDQHLRTDNRIIFAIGDCAAIPGGGQGPHADRHQADLVMRQILFRWPLSYDPLRLPRAALIDPEWAAIGLTEDEARARHGAISVLRSAFADNDRAQAEGVAHGHSKIVLDRRGRLLGVSLLGPSASALIAPWGAFLGRKPSALKATIPPSPSFAETPRRALADADAPLARHKAIRLISSWLRRWG